MFLASVCLRTMYAHICQKTWNIVVGTFLLYELDNYVTVGLVDYDISVYRDQEERNKD